MNVWEGINRVVNRLEERGLIRVRRTKGGKNILCIPVKEKVITRVRVEELPQDNNLAMPRKTAKMPHNALPVPDPVNKERIATPDPLAAYEGLGKREAINLCILRVGSALRTSVHIDKIMETVLAIESALTAGTFAKLPVNCHHCQKQFTATTTAHKYCSKVCNEDAWAAKQANKAQGAG